MSAYTGTPIPSDEGQRATVNIGRWILAVLAVGSVVVVLPTAAQAARPATPTEAEQIASSLRLDVECVDATISTAPGSEAGYARLGRPTASHCAAGNGVRAISLRDGRWHAWFDMAYGDLQPCEDYGAPAAVGRDLGICSPRLRRTEVIGLGGVFVKPRRLPQGAHGAYVNLRWSAWTRTQAVGRGVLDYSDRDMQFRVPVRVRLYRARICDDGTRLFTRRQITAVRKSDHKKISFDTRYRSIMGCDGLDVARGYE